MPKSLDDPPREPNRPRRVVPVGPPSLRAAPPHDGGELDVHRLEDALGEVQVVPPLVGQPQVVQLPGVGRQVEDVVLGALAEAAVARGEHGLEADRLAAAEDRADDVAAESDVRVRRARHETPEYLGSRFAWATLLLGLKDCVLPRRERWASRRR